MKNFALTLLWNNQSLYNNHSFITIDLSVLFIIVYFFRRTEVLKKFKDIRKQKDSALYENEIRLDNRVYHDLTLARGDNDSPYDAIYLIPKIG